MEDILVLPNEIKLNPQYERIGIDCGGSVMKLVSLQENGDKQGLSVITKHYAYEEMDDMLMYIKTCIGEEEKDLKINTTGVYIIPFTAKIEEILKRKIVLRDEFTSYQSCFRGLVSNLPKHQVVIDKDEATKAASKENLKAGYSSAKLWKEMSKLDFRFLESAANESDICDVVQVEADEKMSYINADDKLYPCLIVTIGSATTIIKYQADGSREFISLNPMGGRTLLALGALLTGAKSYAELMALAMQGDNTKLDRLVADFKGDDKSANNVYDSGMNFGDMKLFTMGKAVSSSLGDWQPVDVARSLLGMVLETLAFWIDSCAHMEGIGRVFIAGGVVSHPLARSELSKYLDSNLWTRGRGFDVEYSFLKYGTHYGALGAIFTD